MPRRATIRVPGERPTLRRALAYSNEQIVLKFTDKWDVSPEDAEELFTETKRLVWLMATTTDRGFQFRIDAAILILDEMWHNFVLFTKEYTAYCERLYGRFIHHMPTTHADVDRNARAFERDPEAYTRRDTELAVRQWQLITDVCGQDTLLKWYVELPTRYGAAFFRDRGKVLPMSYRPPAALVQLMERRRAEAPNAATARRAPRAAGARRGARATRATGTDQPRGT